MGPMPLRPSSTACQDSSVPDPTEAQQADTGDYDSSRQIGRLRERMELLLGVLFSM